MTYLDFIRAKMPRAEAFGFEPPSEPHPCLKEHQRDIAAWMCRGGRRADFASFGLGKSRTQLQLAKWIHEKTGLKYLIVAPLGVRSEFINGEGPAMGMTVQYCRTDAEVSTAGPFIITNYERVRDGGITLNPEVFAGAGLDEASCLRSYGSLTYQNFLKLFKSIPYRFVFTATPSPNKHKELIHYGGFLGVMDTGEALTRFFKRNSEKANDLTLYPHMEEKFWLWLSSWAVFMQRPSDLGYSDEGYDLPEMKVHWHCIPVDHKKAWKQTDSWGQAQLFLDQSSGLSELAEVKRDTILHRIEFAKGLMGTDGRNWLLWHDLEAERHAIEKLVPGVKTAYGSQDLEEREEIIQQFAQGKLSILATKPSIAGSGTNLQKYCSSAIFLGSTYKFNDFIQAVHRIHRFQQKEQVNIHVIYSESETPVIETLKKKWAQHDELVARMVELLKKFKLSLKPDMQLQKTIGCDRKVVVGDKFKLFHNDNVLELQEETIWPEDCVDEIVTSIPFGNQYEYSPSFNDFGHNPSNEEFFQQMDFLIPHLLRILKPGRVACIHVKDRIRFGNVTGLGMPTVDPFSDKTVSAFTKHGFAFMGRITIDTDVVRENNQTYRLGWTENSKDSTKMGVGMPEYVLLFRKLPSDLSDAYADTPVTKDKEQYTRAHWQIDAASLWRSNGNRLPDPEYLAQLPMETVGRIWKKHAREKLYDYNEHVAISLGIEKHGRLPASFMLFPPVSKNPEIWTDIARMRVLNSKLKSKGEESHVCPLQLDIVERLIRRYSNPGEIVLDPFCGVGTVPYLAVKMERVGYGIELGEEYWRHSVGFCEQAEREQNVPTLFDFAAVEKEAV
jgi:DNA modification methylase